MKMNVLLVATISFLSIRSANAQQQCGAPGQILLLL